MNVTTPTGADAALLLLAASIFISLIIERLLEILKSIYDVLEAKYNWHHWWNRRATAVQDMMESFLADSATAKTTLKQGAERLRLQEAAYKESHSVSVAQLRARTIKITAKALGITLGVIIAWFASIDMFQLIDQLRGETAGSLSGYSWLTVTLTGVAMGLGSGPIHKIIARIEKAKRNRVDAIAGGRK